MVGDVTVVTGSVTVTVGTVTVGTVTVGTAVVPESPATAVPDTSPSARRTRRPQSTLTASAYLEGWCRNALIPSGGGGI